MNKVNKMDKKNFLFYSLLFYFSLTYLLYQFGPLEYPKVNNMKSSIFLLSYFLLFIIGYYGSRRIGLINTEQIKNRDKELKFFLKLGLLLSAFFSIAFLVNFSGSLNPITIGNNIYIGLRDPEIAYLNNLNMEKKSGLITKITTLFSPITYAVVPMGIYYFKKLSLGTKVMLILVVMLDLLQFIIKGTNFGILRITVTIIISLSVVLSFKGVNINKKKMITLISILLLFFIFYLLKTISSRLGYVEIPDTYMGLLVNKDHMLFKILPMGLSIPIFIATTYLSQGYYGFSLAFNYPFTTTYGLGSGRFLISYGEKIFDIDLWNRTYQAKMDSIWSSRVSWHTFFTWFANDVGFYGVFIIMLILGVLFGLVVADAYDNKNLIAVILLPLYVILLIFIPANNIVFDNPVLFMPFIVINFIWFITLLTRYINRKRISNG